MSTVIRRSIGFALYSGLCLTLIGAPAVDGARTSETSAPAQETPSLAIGVPSRPAALMPLYISFSTLQILDVHSTLRAPEFGGTEANPLLRGIVGSPVALVATKAGVSAAVMLATERLWKRNKAAAVLMMIGLNSVYAGVVAHNYIVEARAPALR
jgi:uncharacterized protein DUF5658